MEATLKLDENGFKISSPDELTHLELLGFLELAKDAIINTMKTTNEKLTEE